LEVLAKEDYKPLLLAPNTKLPQIDYIPDGNVILIRFIRGDRKLDVFGERFTVSKELVYSYVKAVIVTEIHAIKIYLGDDFVEAFEYRLPAEIFS